MSPSPTSHAQPGAARGAVAGLRKVAPEVGREMGRLAAEARRLRAEAQVQLAQAAVLEDQLLAAFRGAGLNPGLHVVHTEADVPLASGACIEFCGVYDKATSAPLGQDLRPLPGFEPPQLAAPAPAPNRAARRAATPRR